MEIYEGMLCQKYYVREKISQSAVNLMEFSVTWPTGKFNNKVVIKK